MFVIIERIQWKQELFPSQNRVLCALCFVLCVTIPCRKFLHSNVCYVLSLNERVDWKHNLFLHKTQHWILCVAIEKVERKHNSFSHTSLCFVWHAQMALARRHSWGCVVGVEGRVGWGGVRWGGVGWGGEVEGECESRKPKPSVNTWMEPSPPLTTLIRFVFVKYFTLTYMFQKCANCFILVTIYDNFINRTVLMSNWIFLRYDTLF